MDTTTIIQDFILVAALAGRTVSVSQIEAKTEPAPHIPPTKLPPGKMAIYVFSYEEQILKVGKAGPNSSARFTSQHYNPGSAPSTLAATLIKAGNKIGIENLTNDSAGSWIKQNTTRTNFLLDINCGIAVLSLFEAFLQCRLNPKYEGFASQQ